MKKYKSIEEVKKACESGELDESKLQVVMDNDTVGFYYGEVDEDLMEGDKGYIDNTIFEGDGYQDIGVLYPIVFPKAKVEWC